jgi:hypothetical protein
LRKPASTAAHWHPAFRRMQKRSVLLLRALEAGQSRLGSRVLAADPQCCRRSIKLMAERAGAARLRPAPAVRRRLRSGSLQRDRRERSHCGRRSRIRPLHRSPQPPQR